MVAARNVLKLCAGSTELISIQSNLVNLLWLMHIFLNLTEKEKRHISQLLKTVAVQRHRLETLLTVFSFSIAFFLVIWESKIPTSCLHIHKHSDSGSKSKPIPLKLQISVLICHKMCSDLNSWLNLLWQQWVQVSTFARYELWLHVPKRIFFYWSHSVVDLLWC